MLYSVVLNIKGRDDLLFFHDSYLPGIVPDCVVDMMRCVFVREVLGLCAHCTLDKKCHVVSDGGVKYCIALFHDVFRPSWRIADLA